MYKITQEIQSSHAEALADHYLNTGAISVSLLTHESLKNISKLWILAETVKWFKDVGITQKPTRLKKSDWEYSYESTITQQILIPGWKIHSALSKIEAEANDSHILKLDLRGAFGDGAHPTTQLCARYLEKIILEQSPNALVDIGSGTGVLAIMAAKMGVKKVEAFDVDAISVKRIRSNVALNNVDIKVQKADILKKIPTQLYDVVVANLHSDLIQRSLVELKLWMAPEGWLILSGISAQWKAQLSQQFKDKKLRICEEKEQDGWWGFLLQKM